MYAFNLETGDWEAENACCTGCTRLSVQYAVVPVHCSLGVQHCSILVQGGTAGSQGTPDWEKQLKVSNT